MGNLSQSSIGRVASNSVNANILSYSSPFGHCSVNVVKYIALQYEFSRICSVGVFTTLLQRLILFVLLLGICKEVFELASKSNISFSHVKQSAIKVVDGLAMRRVVTPHLVVDILSS